MIEAGRPLAGPVKTEAVRPRAGQVKTEARRPRAGQYVQGRLGIARCFWTVRSPFVITHGP